MNQKDYSEEMLRKRRKSESKKKKSIYTPSYISNRILRMNKNEKILLMSTFSCMLFIFCLVYYFFMMETLVRYPRVIPFIIKNDHYLAHPSKLESHLLEIFESQRSQKTKFRGAYIPCEFNVGLGNDLLGFTNLILFSLFTNSTFFIPPQFGFKSRTRPYSRYLPLKHPLLQQYSIFPPNDEKLRRLIETSKNDCLRGKRYTDPMIYLYNKRSSWFNYLDYKFKEFESTSDDIYPNWRSCSDYVCKHVISSNEKLVHTGDLDNSVEKTLKKRQFYCLREWRNGFWAQHVFKSEKKTKFLCENLKLCEGIDWENINFSNPPEGGHQKKGLRLVGNMFRELFKFNLNVFKGLTHDELRDVKETKKESKMMISIQVRTYYTTKKDLRDIIKNCLRDILIDEKESGRLFDGDKIGLFFTTDLHSFDHSKFFNDDVPSVLQSASLEDLKIRAIYPYSKGGSTSQTVINVDDEEGDLAKKRLLYDLYVQTQSDVHAITEQSTFGAWGAMISDSHVKDATNSDRRIRIFRDRMHFVDNKDRTCVSNRPYLVCPRSACPYDFL